MIDKITPAMMLGGGYNGARFDRVQLSNWLQVGGSPQSDVTNGDLATLRARSRDQMRNSPIAVGALNLTTSHVVGTGLSCAPAINAARLGLTQDDADAWQDDVRYRFNVWAGSVDCDFERRQNFFGKQEVFFRSWQESGDAFAITPLVTRGGLRSLVVQVIEADRVCNPRREQNSPTMVDGIEIIPETGEAIAIYVAKKHPGDPTAAEDNHWTRVQIRGGATDRRNVLHGMTVLRPGQVRGIPFIAPVLEPLKQLQRWSDAELQAAVVSSVLPLFVKMDPNAFSDLFDAEAKSEVLRRSSWSGEVEGGKAVNLLPGESIESPAPGRPNPAFDPFWQAMVRQIGIALGLPFEVLIAHFQSSYSAARGAILMAWKMFRHRRDLLSSAFCQPLYETWLAEEVAAGRVSAPGFFSDPMIRAAWSSAVWTGDAPGSIDPKVEVEAAKERILLEISTLEAESILHDGVDWATKHKKRAREIADQKLDGTWQPGAPQPKEAQKPDQKAEAAHAATMAALTALSDRVAAIAQEPRSITVNTPPVEVHTGDVHVTPPAVTVEGHEINVSLPEGCIQLEANMTQPDIHVTAPQAQVTVLPAQATRQKILRDADGEIAEVLTTQVPQATH